MSTTQNLKFFHLGSTVAAAEGSYDKGAIIFEPKSGRIAVKGNSGLEYYGGGRIADATFENKILTLSFNDGTSAITLDFTDTASAEGVNKILGKLRTDVDALKATVNGTDKGGVHTPGLVDKVDNNTANIAANTTSIQANADAIAGIKNESTGILANAKKYTDDEIVKLRGGVDGYKGTLKDLDGNIKSNDTDIANLRALHADGTGETAVDGKMKVIDEINAKVGEIDTDTVKAYVDKKVETINGDATKLSARVTTLETTVNGNGSDVTGLVNDVADNTSKLTTLIGSDASKSVRTIANEELAAQLIPEHAVESLDTLQEIAAWIQSHPGDASKMNIAIGNLQTSVGTAGAPADANGSVYARIAKNAADITANATNIGTNATNISNNAAAIDALEALHADKDDKTGKKTVKQEVADGIKSLGTVTKTNDEGDPKTADVVVTVTTTEGKVSAVGVDASVLKKAVTDEVDRAKKAETDISNKLGEQDAAADTSASASAFGRIKALEEKQSSGTLMWSDWQEN